MGHGSAFNVIPVYNLPHVEIKKPMGDLGPYACPILLPKTRTQDLAPA